MLLHELVRQLLGIKMLIYIMYNCSKFTSEKIIICSILSVNYLDPFSLTPSLSTIFFQF